MRNELKILMLEDLEDDAGLVSHVLRKEQIIFSLKRVDSREEFIDALEDFEPDVILSDHMLPQFNSMEALKVCQERRINVPFILVTGTVSEEFAVSCLKQGADDYILKSSLSRLPLAIQYSLRQRNYEKLRKRNEETLRRQNEELIKINQELDSFVYSVSHNLRSPLSSILGVVRVAELDPNREQQAIDNYFSLIKDSVLKLDQTIRDILNYSRNSRSELQIAKVNLKGVIEDSFEQVNYIPGFNVICKTTQITGEDIPVYSDGRRLSILLGNLISNAIKYTDPLKENQFIHTTAHITPEMISIQIHDNGIGIHPDYLPHIYKMFYRATEDSDGAGLGLYIVKEIVDKLGGTIDVTSRIKEETCVVVKIPNRKDTFLVN